MIDYLKEFKDKGFFTCADILNKSEREELLSNIDQIERNVLTHPVNKKEMDPNNTSRLRKINDLTLNLQYFFNISKKNEILNVKNLFNHFLCDWDFLIRFKLFQNLICELKIMKYYFLFLNIIK